MKRRLLLGWAYAVVLVYLYSIWIEKVSKEIQWLL